MSSPVHPQPRPAADYTREEMTALLREGARVTGWSTDQAAVHLITRLEIIGTSQFAAHVTIRVTRDPGTGKEVTVATVTDWGKLRDDRLFDDLPGSEHAMVALAASFADRQVTVGLQGCYLDLDMSYAYAAAEAVLIATGTDAYLLVTAKGTPRPGVSYGGTV